MNGRLTRGELRIIEETKRQGKELHETEKQGNKNHAPSVKELEDASLENPDGNKAAKKGEKTNVKAAVISMTVFALIFLILAFVVKLFISWMSR